jgi:hypothetical protein
MPWAVEARHTKAERASDSRGPQPRSNKSSKLMACLRQRGPDIRKNIVNFANIVEIAASPFFPIARPIPGSLAIFGKCRGSRMDVTVSSFGVMQRSNVFIKLKTGQNRVDSLLTKLALGHF